MFIHCWTCDRHIWDAQMSAFAKTHRVVAIDLAGHGESGKERKDWTMPPEQIEALARRKT